MIWQFVAQGLVSGGVSALLAVGFGLILNTTRVFHFAHGAVFMCAGYVAWVLLQRAHAGLALGTLGTMAAAALLGVGMERAVYRPFRLRDAPQRVVMIVSLALMILLENVVVVLAGSQIKNLDAGWLGASLQLGSVFITRLGVATVLLAGLALAGLTWFLRRTRYGWAVLAMASDAELAETVGIGAESVRLLTFALGSAIAGLASVLVALDSGLTPPVGFNATLIATVAVIVGGIGSLSGAALGGLLLGLLENLSVIWISSSWQYPVAYAVLILVILWRPRGLLVR